MDTKKDPIYCLVLDFRMIAEHHRPYQLRKQHTHLNNTDHRECDEHDSESLVQGEKEGNPCSLYSR